MLTSPHVMDKTEEIFDLLLTLDIKAKALSLYHMQTVSPICIIINSPQRVNIAANLKKKLQSSIKYALLI